MNKKLRKKRARRLANVAEESAVQAPVVESAPEPVKKESKSKKKAKKEEAAEVEAPEVEAEVTEVVVESAEDGDEAPPEA